jgi:hypothetical protein
MSVTRIGIALLLVLLVLGSSGPSPVAIQEQPVGGRQWFFCVLSATLVVGGMITFHPEAVLVGNLVGGLACPFGW